MADDKLGTPADIWLELAERPEAFEGERRLLGVVSDGAWSLASEEIVRGGECECVCELAVLTDEPDGEFDFLIALEPWWGPSFSFLSLCDRSNEVNRWCLPLLASPLGCSSFATTAACSAASNKLPA